MCPYELSSVSRRPRCLKLAEWAEWAEGQLVDFLVRETQRALVAGDLELELGTVAAACAPAEPFKPLAGIGQSFLRPGPLLFDLAFSLGK